MGCDDCGVKKIGKHLRNLGRAHKRGALAGLGATAMPGNDPGQVPWGLGEAGGRWFGDEDIGGLGGIESDVWPMTTDIDDATTSCTAPGPQLPLGSTQIPGRLL